MDVTRSAYRIPEIIRRNNVSRSTIYEAIRAGKLKAKKNGKITLITAEAEREWLDAMPALELK
jgi:excisionase family DNA binding protein